MITKEFYVNNRRNIIRLLKSGALVLSAYSALQRQNDMAFAFSQESNFWYLTGIANADWKLVVDITSGEEWLIAPEVDAVHQVFDGSLSANAASELSGIKKVISYDEGLVLLRALAKKHSTVYTIDQPQHADYFNFLLNPSIANNKRTLERLFSSVMYCQKELSGLRAIKQPEEIKMIQKAVDITIGGFEYVKKSMNSYKHEYELDADISWVMRRTGATGHAYDPIIAAGKNACTLHYSHNDSVVKSRQLVLLDVGASCGGYAADITRTYAKHEPTKRQVAVHAAVESAHREIIGLIKPSVSIQEYQQRVNEIMSEAIDSLGLGKNDDALHKYFPHAVSHGLGIDVHDSLGAPSHLVENMVLTVEPGVYIPEEGIGVRIEDDILVTAKGNKNLSSALSTGL